MGLQLCQECYAEVAKHKVKKRGMKNFILLGDKCHEKVVNEDEIDTKESQIHHDEGFYD